VALIKQNIHIYIQALELSNCHHHGSILVPYTLFNSEVKSFCS